MLAVCQKKKTFFHLKTVKLPKITILKKKRRNAEFQQFITYYELAVYLQLFSLFLTVNLKKFPKKKGLITVSFVVH